MKIDTLFWIQGIFVLIFVFLTIFIGILIASKYFKYNQKNLIFIGFAWMGMAFPWSPEVIAFFIIITNATVNYDLVFFVDFLLNVILPPIFLTIWLIAITDLLELKKTVRSSIIILSILFSVIIDFIMFYLYFTNLNLIGKISLNNLTMIEWTLAVNIMLLICGMIVLMTGILFVRASLKSTTPEIRLKGKLLLIAFILFTIGGVIELETTLISNIISRSLLALSSVVFYIGFVLPEWVKKKLLKNEQIN